MGKRGVKKRKKDLYCSGNSVFKCLSQLLKELFVIEQTCWMQTLVDLSAGCIDFLWRCVTVVNRRDLYVSTSFKRSFGGSTFYTTTVSGFLHVQNELSFNIWVFTQLRTNKTVQKMSSLMIGTWISFACIVTFAPVNSLSSMPSDITVCRHISPISTGTGQNYEVGLKTECGEIVWYLGIKGKYVGTLKSGYIVPSWFKLYV